MASVISKILNILITIIAVQYEIMKKSDDHRQDETVARQAVRLN